MLQMFIWNIESLIEKIKCYSRQVLQQQKNPCSASTFDFQMDMHCNVANVYNPKRHGVANGS